MIEAAFTGRLGGDIEVMTSRSGKPFARLSVAVGSGETVDAATQITRPPLHDPGV